MLHTLRGISTMFNLTKSESKCLTTVTRGYTMSGQFMTPTDISKRVGISRGYAMKCLRKLKVKGLIQYDWVSGDYAAL